MMKFCLSEQCTCFLCEKLIKFKLTFIANAFGTEFEGVSKVLGSVLCDTL